MTKKGANGNNTKKRNNIRAHIINLYLTDIK